MSMDKREDAVNKIMKYVLACIKENHCPQRAVIEKFVLEAHTKIMQEKMEAIHSLYMGCVGEDKKSLDYEGDNYGQGKIDGYNLALADVRENMEKERE